MWQELFLLTSIICLVVLRILAIKALKLCWRFIDTLLCAGDTGYLLSERNRTKVIYFQRVVSCLLLLRGYNSFSKCAFKIDHHPPEHIRCRTLILILLVDQYLSSERNGWRNVIKNGIDEILFMVFILK